ncbi:type II toxin-antitoxin system RelB/DinJ family antitoxin [Lacticaseibacillus mingshuiensis]|nr:type II toxin-antitoxin system RelB/DinJ family antitoxin [Lacticaseibacillus mingshuiensis]
MQPKDRSVTSLRLDQESKEAARAVFAELVMDLSTGINIYLKQVVVDQGLPFKPTTISPLDCATSKTHAEIERGDFVEFDSLEDFRQDLYS